MFSLFVSLPFLPCINILSRPLLLLEITLDVCLHTYTANANSQRVHSGIITDITGCISCRRAGEKRSKWHWLGHGERRGKIWEPRAEASSSNWDSRAFRCSESEIYTREMNVCVSAAVASEMMGLTMILRWWILNMLRWMFHWAEVAFVTAQEIW